MRKKHECLTLDIMTGSNFKDEAEGILTYKDAPSRYL